ncbi:class I SAM-dependent methyltransferase, partial [Actinocrinis puniceicyclus]
MKSTVDEGQLMLTGPELAKLYEARFTDAELTAKRHMWETLCRRFLSPYIGSGDTVLDLGAGRCEFINACPAPRRVAVDLNPETPRFAQEGVHVVLTASDDLSPIASASVDVVFSSNFFEHLPDKRTLLRTLEECARVLVPGGRLLVLMPNLRFLPGSYWDYFDHHLPLTDRSLVEGMRMAGFEPDRVIPRFLPYTVKDSPLTVRPWLVRTYLKLRWVNVHRCHGCCPTLKMRMSAASMLGPHGDGNALPGVSRAGRWCSRCRWDRQ